MLHTLCLNSEVLRTDPFGFTGMTQGDWEAQALSVFQRAFKAISAEAVDSLGRAHYSHLQTIREGGLPLHPPTHLLPSPPAPHPAQAATQYLAIASSLSRSPGWDPGQALPPLLQAGGC